MQLTRSSVLVSHFALDAKHPYLALAALSGVTEDTHLPTSLNDWLLMADGEWQCLPVGSWIQT